MRHSFVSIWSVSCSTYSKEKEKKENFGKLKCKAIIFCIHHFECRCTSSNTSKICLKPLQNYSHHYSLTYLTGTLTSSNRTKESIPEIKTSSDVVWRHVCFNIMNTDDSQVTWLDVIIAANPVLFSFWLAPEWMNFSIHSGRNVLARAYPAQIRCQQLREFTPTIFQQRQMEPSPVFSEQ